MIASHKITPREVYFTNIHDKTGSVTFCAGKTGKDAILIVVFYVLPRSLLAYPEKVREPARRPRRSDMRKEKTRIRTKRKSHPIRKNPDLSHFATRRTPTGTLRRILRRGELRQGRSIAFCDEANSDRDAPSHFATRQTPTGTLRRILRRGRLRQGRSVAFCDEANSGRDAPSHFATRQTPAGTARRI
jgi:hypothetical protein